MQCPKCSYEPTMSEQQSSPGICPSCGVVYAKVANSSSASIAKDDGGKDLNWPQRKVTELQASRIATSQRATPVAIVDINMPFLSMVFFMVKWVLASIPALIILSIILSIPFIASIAVDQFESYRSLAR